MNKIFTLCNYLNRGLHIGEILDQYVKDLRNEGSTLESLSANKIVQYKSIYTDTKLKAKLHEAAENIFNRVIFLNPDLIISMTGREKSLVSFLTKLSKKIIDSYEVEKPSVEDFVKNIDTIQDILAYRIVFSGADEDVLIGRIYQTANDLVEFMISLGFIPSFAARISDVPSERISPKYEKFFKDYISFPKENQYRSLHIYFSDPSTGKTFEIQFRTLMMDFHAEFGPSNHTDYKDEKYTVSNYVPDEVYFAKKRIKDIHSIELDKVNIPGFFAVNSHGEMKVIDNVGFITPRSLFSRNYVI